MPRVLLGIVLRVVLSNRRGRKGRRLGRKESLFLGRGQDGRWDARKNNNTRNDNLEKYFNLRKSLGKSGKSG